MTTFEPCACCERSGIETRKMPVQGDRRWLCYLCTYAFGRSCALLNAFGVPFDEAAIVGWEMVKKTALLARASKDREQN